MGINNNKPRWFFYLGWIVLNAASVLIAWYIAWALISLIEMVVGSTIQVGGQSRITEDFLFVYVIFPTIGLLSGITQFMLLRRSLPRMAGWAPATFLGWLLPFVAGFIITSFLAVGNSTLWIVLGLFLIGALISVPQWWILRKRLRHAIWWVLAYGCGWGLVGLLNLVTSEPFPVLLAVAWLPAISTGIVLWLLLDRLPSRAIMGDLAG
ncbi:MAG: hypothetical protein R3335_02080 [Anaerolineales bacterium]|nr:hypothetical protein [Anaerolineales bacterium]